MLLILEIILTVAAWRKGWRWRALLPLGFALFLGLVIGVAVGSAGGSIEDVQVLALFLDLVCLGVLILMSKHAPQKTSRGEYHYQIVSKELVDSNGSHIGKELVEVDEWAGNQSY